MAALVAGAAKVIAHSDSPNETYHMMDAGMMEWCLESGGCHGVADMMGYGWWGMGWSGLLVGLSLWALVILGIIYLARKILEQRPEQKDENQD